MAKNQQKSKRAQRDKRSYLSMPKKDDDDGQDPEENIEREFEMK